MCYDVMYFPHLQHHAHFIVLWSTHLQHLYWWLTFYLFNQSSTIRHVGYSGCFSLLLLHIIVWWTSLYFLYLPLSHLVAQAKNLRVILDSSFPLFILHVPKAYLIHKSPYYSTFLYFHSHLPSPSHHPLLDFWSSLLFLWLALLALSFSQNSQHNPFQSDHVISFPWDPSVSSSPPPPTNGF